MALHVIFIDNHGQQLSDVTSNFTSVTIPQNAFIMRIADDTKSYSNSTLTKLFEIDNTFYSKVLEYTTKGDYPFIDINVQDFSGFTAIFNQLSAQFVGNNPPSDIYDFSGYGGSSGGNIDFSTIVTALNSIATALSGLTNLSNLSNLSQLANIITAIQNKDNQSDIVDILDRSFNFVDDSASPTKKRNVFCGHGYGSVSGFRDYPLTSRLNSFYSSVAGASILIRNSLLNTNLEFYASPTSANKLLNSVSSELSNIETKLENNLPFVTNVYPLVETNVDFPYEVKILNKDNCSDNKKNDI